MWCAEPETVMVVAAPGLPAYDEALDGIREVLGKARVNMVLVRPDQTGRAGLEQQLRASAPSLIVTFGTAAMEDVASLGSSVPVICSMVLNGDATAARASQLGLRACSAVYLETPPEALFSALHQLVPELSRIGVIQGNNRPAAEVAGWEGLARESGFQLRIWKCSGPADLLNVLSAMRGQVSLVWVLPDSSLYNSTTVKPLITSSLRSGLPIVGFSESFVRAGAALGIYPDYREVGRQTGEIAVKYSLTRVLPGAVRARKFKLAINENAARLVGLRHSSPLNPEIVVVR